MFRFTGKDVYNETQLETRTLGHPVETEDFQSARSVHIFHKQIIEYFVGTVGQKRVRAETLRNLQSMIHAFNPTAKLYLCPLSLLS